MKKIIEDFYTWNGHPDYWHGSPLPTLTASIWYGQTGKEFKQQLINSLNMGEIDYQIETIFEENERQEVYHAIHLLIDSLCNDENIVFEDTDIHADCVFYLSMKLEELLYDE